MYLEWIFICLNTSMHQARGCGSNVYLLVRPTPDWAVRFQVLAGVTALCSGLRNFTLRPGLNVAFYSNEYVRLIWFKRRIVLPNKIAERERRVLNSHSSKHKLFNLISIQFGTCKMQHLNQLSKFSRIFDWISWIFDWLASNWNVSHLIDLDVAFYMQLIWQFDSAHVKCDV